MRDAQLLLIPGQPAPSTRTPSARTPSARTPSARTPQTAAAIPARLRIDERSRSLGREGIAAARQVLLEVARARAERSPAESGESGDTQADAAVAA